MRSPAARVALPVAVALVVLLSAVAVAPQPGRAQPVGGNATTIAIDLGATGDAHVTVSHQVPLTSAAGSQAFSAMANAHVDGSASQVSIDYFERAVAAASKATGREMAIQGVSRNATAGNQTGRFSLSFTWTNFARVDGDQLVVGDAFRTPSGTWLPRLRSGQELIITFPDGYAVTSVSRPLQNGAIRVEGPTSFSPGSPSAVLAGSPQTSPWWTGPLPAAIGGVLALVLVGGALYVLRDRLPFPGGTDTADPAADATGEDTTAADPAPLLSDEERVLRLLEDRGGRMKQVDIVEATDWSNAKVSQLLSEMAEADQVEKLRIGRENLISLPGEGPGNGG